MCHRINIIKNRLSVYLGRYKNLNVVVKSSFWYTISSVIQKGISIISMPIFTRLLNLHEYGKYNILISWYSIFTIIITLNIQSEIFNKGLIEHEKERDQYMYNQIGLLTLLYLFYLVIYLVFRKPINAFLDADSLMLVIMFSQILSESIISIWSARKRFEFKYKEIVVLTIGQSFFSVLLSIVCVLIAHDKIKAKILSQAIVPIIIGVIIILSIKKKIIPRFNIIWWRHALKMSIPLIPHYLSLIILNQSDKLMIEKFVNTEAAALYSVAHSAGLVMVIVNNSINAVFIPIVYNILRKKDKKDITSITNILFFIVMAVNLILIWMAPELIGLLAAPEYSEAKWCLIPIAISVYFFFLYTLFVDIEIYYEKTYYITFATIISSIINIILNYIFVRQFGYIAAGFTTLFCYFLTALLHYFFMKKILKKEECKIKIFNIKITILYAMFLIAFSCSTIVLYNLYLIRYITFIMLLLIIFINRKKIMRLCYFMSAK